MNMMIKDFSVKKLDWIIFSLPVYYKKALNNRRMSNIGMIYVLHIYSFSPRLWAFPWPCDFLHEQK